MSRYTSGNRRSNVFGVKNPTNCASFQSVSAQNSFGSAMIATAHVGNFGTRARASNRFTKSCSPGLCPKTTACSHDSSKPRTAEISFSSVAR